MERPLRPEPTADPSSSSLPPAAAPRATPRRPYHAPTLARFGAAAALTEVNSMTGRMDGWMGRRTG